jgi:hypothetical protein
VDAYVLGLGAIPRDVAASVAAQAVVAHVATPVLLAAAVCGVDLDVDLADVRWRPHGRGLRFGLASLRTARRPRPGLPELVSDLGHRVVTRWVELVVPATGLPARQVWGGAAAALWTAVSAVHEHRPLDEPELVGLAAAIDGIGEGAASGLVVAVDRVEPGDPLRWRRATCCQIHLAGLLPCDECPLVTTPGP